MATTIYYDADANLEHLAGQTIAVIGYGSQGHAHALNAQESGLNVVVGLRRGSKSWAQAERDGLRVLEVAEAAKAADLVMILLPDEAHGPVFRAEIEPNLQEGNAVLVAHGFSVHFSQVVVPAGVDCFMVAPKGPGHLVRRTYTQGAGVPCLVAIHKDATGTAKQRALAYAKAIGGARAGVLETTFKEETETDLFGEQSVLCGGVTALMEAGFNTLVEAGYQPEIAYFECVHEMKLIVDLIYEGGFAKMRHSISNTAEFGDYVTAPRIVTPAVREEMKRVLEDIRSGAFARSFLLENTVGQPTLKTGRRRSEESQVAEVGKRLRKMMPFIGEGE